MPAMRLALREIRRAKLRFGLLTGAVGLLVFLILFQQTLLSTLLGFFTGALEHQSAEVVVYNDEARRNVEGSVVTADQVDAVAAVEGVARAEPLGEGTFTVEADGELTDAVLFGYVLGGPGAPTRLSDGRLPERDGEGVASSIDRDRGFDLGDEVVVQPGGVPIRIVGLAEESRFSVLPAVFVTYATFEEAKSARNPDSAGVLPSLVAVQPADGVEPEALAARITAAVEGVEALDRATAVEELPGVSSVSQSFSVILALAFVVVALVTGIFFVILTVQKATSLALLRAVGAGAGYLTAALLVQVVLVVLGGIGVGTALLGLAAAASGAEFPISVEPSVVATRGAAVAALALLASLAAIRRVLRIDPFEATTRPGAT
ncbi:MAG: ABC transporter permease [Acidimicrobiia bacterium]|nr:ABC transporter permease [Acidimicrobiia bacterium]